MCLCLLLSLAVCAYVENMQSLPQPPDTEGVLIDTEKRLQHGAFSDGKVKYSHQGCSRRHGSTRESRNTAEKGRKTHDTPSKQNGRALVLTYVAVAVAAAGFLLCLWQ